MLIWVVRSIYQAFIIIYFNVIVFECTFDEFTGIAFTSLILVILLNVVSEVNHWNRIMIISVVSSVIFYFVSIIFFNSYFNFTSLNATFMIKSIATALLCYIPIVLIWRLVIWINPPNEKKLMHWVTLKKKTLFRKFVDKFCLCRKDHSLTNDFI